MYRDYEECCKPIPDDNNLTNHHLSVITSKVIELILI